MPLPGTALVYPIDTALVTLTKPLNIATEMPAIIQESLHYFAAYDPGSTKLNDKNRYFRFTARTHTTADELPPGGSLVWWRKLSDTNAVGNFICRRTDMNGRITLDSNGLAGDAPEPDPAFRDRCSWTLWKQATEEKWAIRAPQGKSDANGGMFVTAVHGSPAEGDRIRVDGSTINNGPFFELIRKK